MDDLFPDASAVPPPTSEEKQDIRPDFYLEYARKVCGVPEDWRWFKLEVVGYQLQNPKLESTLITGAVAPLVTKGKWAGKRRNWKARDKRTEYQISVSRPAMAEFRQSWEAETGKCSDCGGRGEVVWSIGPDGSKYRPCNRCSSTGNAPDAAVPL